MELSRCQAPSPLFVAEYKYDIYGRRIRKNVNGLITNFHWEGDNMSFELNENHQPIRRYIYENGKDDVQGYVEYAEVDDPQYFSFERKGWYSYIKDQVGTITKVYKHETKQMVNTRTYDAFGNLINQTGSSNGNLGFQSKYYDQESGLNYYYHRYYNPSTGRFINEDPIGLSGGLNMYGFVSNNTLNRVDKYGLISGKVSIFEHPMNYPDWWEKWGISYPGGLTDAFWDVSFDCECINGKWQLKFDFWIRIHVVWCTSGSKYNHEMRHALDMVEAFLFNFNILMGIEDKYTFDTKNECIMFGSKARQFVFRSLDSAVRTSILLRDWLPPFFLFESLF